MNTGSQQKPRYKIKQNKQKPQETQPKTWPHEYLVEPRANLRRFVCLVCIWLIR